MRFLIFFIMISCFFRVCASDYTLLDASGGAWDGSGLFRRMLSEKVSLLPEKDSLALEKVSALPDKLEAGQIAVVAGNAEDWKNKGYKCRILKAGKPGGEHGGQNDGNEKDDIDTDQRLPAGGDIFGCGVAQGAYIAKKIGNHSGKKTC